MPYKISCVDTGSTGPGSFLRVGRGPRAGSARIAGAGWRARAAGHIAILIFALAMAAAAPAPVLTAAGAQRPIGDTRVFAAVPYPGHPTGIVVDADTAYVATGVAVDEPRGDWRIFAYDVRTGRQRTNDTITIPRENAISLMGLQGLAFDEAGRMYAVDMNGRILRSIWEGADRGHWEVYATLPTHGVWPASTMPDDLAFDRKGNLYVADAAFPGIWRISPGGARVDLWFADPRLLPSPYGLCGIRLDPSGQDLYFTVCTEPGHLLDGGVYRLPIDRPSSSNLREVFHYRSSTPVGLAFGRSGKLYVALSGVSAPTRQGNQISVLRPDGTEESRFPGPSQNASVPYDTPSYLAFDGRGSLLVTNNASFTQDPHHWAVLAAFVNDTESPLVRPMVPFVIPIVCPC